MKQTGQKTPASGKRLTGVLTTRQAKRNGFVLAVLLPFAAWMLVYMLIPLASVIFYSFTNAKMAYDDFRFVGLYQFQKLFPTARRELPSGIR